MLERIVATEGGAVLVYHGSLTFDRSSVRDNVGSYYKSGRGGGIAAGDSTVVLTGSAIVRASTDADSATGLEIQITGSKMLTAGDSRF